MTFLRAARSKTPILLTVSAIAAAVTIIVFMTSGGSTTASNDLDNVDPELLDSFSVLEREQSQVEAEVTQSLPRLGGAEIFHLRSLGTIDGVQYFIGLMSPSEVCVILRFNSRDVVGCNNASIALTKGVTIAGDFQYPEFPFTIVTLLPDGYESSLDGPAWASLATPNVLVVNDVNDVALAAAHEQPVLLQPSEAGRQTIDLEAVMSLARGGLGRPPGGPRTSD